MITGKEMLPYTLHCMFLVCFCMSGFSLICCLWLLCRLTSDELMIRVDINRDFLIKIKKSDFFYLYRIFLI